MKTKPIGNGHSQISKEHPTSTKYKSIHKVLTVIREKSMKEENLKISNLLTENKVTSNLSRILDDLGVWSRSEQRNPKEGVKVKWLYINSKQEIPDAVDDNLVQIVIERDKEIANVYARRQSERKRLEKESKHQSATRIPTAKIQQPTHITSAIKQIRTFDKTTVEGQIFFYQQELDKEAQVPGYLRPKTVEMYGQMIITLQSYQSIAESIPGVMTLLGKINQQIHGK